MVNGPGRSDGGQPDPIDGETGGESADETQGNTSQPPHSATPRGNIDPRLGGLIPDPEGNASTGRTSSFRSSSDAGLQAELDLLTARANRAAELDAQSNELLPAPLRLAYEQSEKLNERAARVRNLDAVKAVLAQEGIGGPPPLPDNTPGAMPRFIGGPQLARRERPKPLSTLAMRVSSEACRGADRFEALMLGLGAINEVPFKRHRVEPLADMAEAVSSVANDDLRTEGYEAVLRAAERLWKEQEDAQEKEREISAAEHAHIVVSLSLNFRCLSGDTSDTREKLLLAIEKLPEDAREAAYRSLDD